MNDLLKSLPEKHPFIFNVITVVIPALLILSLFVIFDPFGFNKLELANRVVVYIMLGLLCLLAGAFFRWIFSRSL